MTDNQPSDHNWQTIRPSYDNDTLSIPAIRALIWSLAKANQYTITIAKARCGYDNNGSLYQYSKLLKEVQKLRKEAEEFKNNHNVIHTTTIPAGIC